MSDSTSAASGGTLSPRLAGSAGSDGGHRRQSATGGHHPHRPASVERPLSAFFAEPGADPLAVAFRGRQAVHPFVGLEPVPEDAVAGIWQRLCETPRGGPSVAYVHIPFCFNHCLYCGFYQNAWHPADGPGYVERVIEQLRRGRDLPMQAQGPIRALYFGGGTPTLLAARDLARLIEAARVHLPLAPDCEITVEGRIHGFGQDKTGADCLAFGAGAGGSMNGPDAGFSYRNIAAVETYKARIGAGAPVVAGLMRQSPHRRLFDSIKGGLERGRLNAAAVAAQLQADTGLDWQALAEPLLVQWQQAGLLTRDGDWVELTLAGRFWQVQLTLNLLQWLSQALTHRQA